MRSLHRGDIYQVRFAPTVFYSSGAPGYVLIMKNDDGSIPCETADVILVNPVCNRSKGLVLGQGFRPDFGRCIRIPKRCLRRLVDFIRPEQLRAIMRCFDVPGTDIATLVRPFAESDGLAALENPNSPKVVLDGESRAIYFSRSVIPYLRGVPREEWLSKHTFYKHIGLYAFRAEVLRAVTALPQSVLELAESLEQLRWLENGYKIGVGISDVETIGIDTPEDLARAEEFLARIDRR